MLDAEFLKCRWQLELLSSGRIATCDGQQSLMCLETRPDRF